MGLGLKLDESQLTTQSWDSHDLLPDSQLLPGSLLNKSLPSPPLFIPDSQADSSQELSQGS